MDENTQNIQELPLPAGDVVVRKDLEFEKFLELLKNGKYETWEMVADALKVDTSTVARWRRHPRAMAITAEAIEDAVKQMEDTGRRDWRMWEAKLKLLNVGKETAKTQLAFGVNTNINLQGGEDEPSIVRRIVGIIEEIKSGAEGESGTEGIERGEIVSATEGGEGQNRPVVLPDGAGVDAGRTQQGESDTAVPAEGVPTGSVGPIPGGTPIVDRKE